MNDIFVPADDLSALTAWSSDYCETVRQLHEAVRNGTAKRKRRERKPSVASLIKRAERHGKTVTAITTADGVTLQFGEQLNSEPNPWERAMQGPKQ